jgi:hypothetical protein
MTRCEEFYRKVEKDGNFCGMSESSISDVKQYRELLAENSAIADLTEGAARGLIREKDKDVKAKAIEVIAKQLKDGEKVTAKIVKEDLKNAGHEEKEVDVQNPEVDFPCASCTHVCVPHNKELEYESVEEKLTLFVEYLLSLGINANEIETKFLKVLKELCGGSSL